MRKKLKPNWLLTIGFIGVWLLFMVWAENNLSAYYIKILHFWGINAILGVAFQLIYGYTGQLSFAHAGLIAVGAYTVGLLTLSPEAKSASFILVPPIWPISVAYWPFLPALLLGGLLAAIIGFVIGAPALKVRGDYLAMATLGFSEVIRMVLVNMPSVVNGAMGLKGIPLRATLVTTWILAIVVVFITKKIVDSSYGRALKAICEDEIAAEALGINLFYHKTISFVISSFFVGIGGALLAGVLGTIDPNSFRLYLAYAAITIVVLGGMRSLTGCILASGIYIIMSELLRAVESPRIVWGVNIPGVPGLRVEIFGLMLLLLILYRRQGLLGAKEFSWKSLANVIRSLFPRGKMIRTVE